MDTAIAAYNKLIMSGATPQEARSVLPNSLKTEIVVTANLREWRHILKLRTAKTAHPQMRELMIPLLQDLRRLIPIVFDDIQEYHDDIQEGHDDIQEYQQEDQQEDQKDSWDYKAAC